MRGAPAGVMINEYENARCDRMRSGKGHGCRRNTIGITIESTAGRREKDRPGGREGQGKKTTRGNRRRGGEEGEGGGQRGSGIRNKYKHVCLDFRNATRSRTHGKSSLLLKPIAFAACIATALSRPLYNGWTVVVRSGRVGLSCVVMVVLYRKVVDWLP